MLGTHRKIDIGQAGDGGKNQCGGRIHGNGLGDAICSKSKKTASNGYKTKLVWSPWSWEKKREAGRLMLRGMQNEKGNKIGDRLVRNVVQPCL